MKSALASRFHRQLPLLLLPILVVAWAAPAPAVQFPPEMPWSVFASGIGSVDMLAFDAAGLLHANREVFSGGGTDTVNASGQHGQWVTGLNRADGIVFHAPSGDFFVSEEVTPGRVRRIDAAGNKTTVVSTSQINGPEGLSLHPVTGDLYIAEDRFGGRIRVYDLGTGAVSTFWSGLSRPEGIAFHPSGDLYVAETATNRILRIDSTPSLSVFIPSAGGLVNPDNIIWDDSLGVFLADEDVASTGRIFWLTEEGDARVLATGINAPQGMTFDAQGNLYVSEQFANRILRIDGVYAHQAFNVTVPSTDHVSAQVSWNTFRRSSSRVEYGLDTSYGNLTTLDPALVVDHVQTVSGLQPLTTYHFRVLSVAGDGTEFVSPDGTFTTTGTPVGAAFPPGGTAGFSVSASPNPAAGRLAFEFRLPAPARLEITLFDVSGRRVRTLAPGPRGAGAGRVVWDGRSDAGVPLPSGTYFYRARADRQQRGGAVVLVR